MNASKTVTVEPAKLADEFCLILKSWLTPAEQQSVITRNAVEENKSICHSHDFCDANMAMAEAMEKLGVNPDEAKTWGEFTHDGLWKAAWDIAKRNSFGFSKGEVTL